MKKIIFVIDMINGFCKEGALADPKIMGIVPELHDFIEKYEGEKVEIRDSHTNDSLEFKSFPPHCLENSYESDGIDELKDVLNGSLLFKKDSTSALFAPGMMEYLEKEKPEEIVVTGCCTDICILNFVIPLRNYFNEKGIDCDIKVFKELVDTYDSPNHNKNIYNSMAFTLMEQSGAKVLDLFNEKVLRKER